MNCIDTHAHIDGEEFNDDREQMLARASEAGVEAIYVPAIDLASSRRILQLCAEAPQRFPHAPKLYPMVGLHPEEVRADWRQQLDEIHKLLTPLGERLGDGGLLTPPRGGLGGAFIGEVGLDFYWSREFEREQLEAFEQQVQWSVETRLPLMIHCRKAQNEMVAIIKRYARELPGGVFHCFTGNEHEAEELLQFSQFVLGVGGVLTFKKSHLPEVLPAVVPLDRIVLETDAPYMAPVPLRGQRNEPAYVTHVLSRMAQAYGISEAEMAQHTTNNAKRIFQGK